MKVGFYNLIDANELYVLPNIHIDFDLREVHLAWLFFEVMLDFWRK